ncbi:uncharacterized protein LOC119444552 [Dermacentor silvarum]|uniref:uncharacterized protein LOC119444552 n=1 Tax=Dermacentor silvarum TaxID=543639 RepID=UPI0018984CA7|nr:uncharacterized protein LOC119444552 [Dermacentor silvarum]
METTADAPAISTIDVKLPPFWTADPVLWFLQVESQFAARRITADQTKYHHMVDSLPPTTASEVRDLLVAPPAVNAYTTLKQLLISRLTPSEPQRLKQLLHGAKLSDRTPSQLLRHMQQLLGTTTTDVDSKLLRELFLQRLPTNVRMVLASAANKQLSQLAELSNGSGFAIHRGGANIHGNPHIYQRGAGHKGADLSPRRHRSSLRGRQRARGAPGCRSATPATATENLLVPQEARQYGPQMYSTLRLRGKRPQPALRATSVLDSFSPTVTVGCDSSWTPGLR